MEILQLQYFLKIAETQSFTKTSYEFDISQSSLSKHINKLENEIGIKLFERGYRNISLTPAGASFLPHARQIVNDYHEMQTAMKEWTASGTLHIGSIDHIGRVGLTGPIGAFLNDHPNVHIEITRGDTLALMNHLEAHDIDLAFIAHIISPDGSVSNIDTYPLENYRIDTLVRDEYHVIVSKHHPLAKKERIQWQDLANERLVILDESYSIHRIIRDTFRLQGIEPHIAFVSDQVDTLLGLVTDGFGVSILSKRVADSYYDTTAVQIENPIQRNTAIVIPLKQNGRKIIQLFRDQIIYEMSE